MARVSVSFRTLFALAVASHLVACCLGAESQGLQFIIEGGRVQAIEQQEAPPASLDTRVGSPVLELSPLIFGGNVLREEANTGYPEQWLVHFCPSWWEQCQAMLQAYAKEAKHWQRSLGVGLMGPKVRFAMVDCASHKVLCNEQLVEEYPTIVHYRGGVQASRWTASGKNDGQRLKAWLKAQLAPPAAQLQERSLAGLLPQGLMRDLLLVALVLAGNCWVFASTASAELEAPKASGNGAPKGPQQSGCPESVARFLPSDWTCQRDVVL